MKGPGMRLELDVRRKWRCPHCGAVRKTTGAQTAVACDDCADHPLMKVVEDNRRRTFLRPQLDLVIPLHPDDVEAPPFIPPSLAAATEPIETMPANRATPVGPPASGESADRGDANARNRTNSKRGRRKPPGRDTQPASRPEQVKQPAGARPHNDSKTPPPSDAFGDGVLDMT